MADTDGQARRKTLNRLRRARGQLDGVIRAVEQGEACRDVVTQLAAVSSALDRAGFTIISAAMQECVNDRDTQVADGLDLDELEKLFLTLA
ncbi:metal-sensitive transcriptional regulator [Propionimicrobium sp. PCR01-08-3]|uniref:metal-sensitive transcriptional regulator n=1 Tax=Propionimicrobium sp. PCR01-08-3 TaxID=3052086 RepID=UPI00255CE60D|nr:metal-sensitive transcriptional regulator [Propionimicrobium sp. PCR01-08-3]WIY84048.1 metal-sensitive transcriptional regulator [Propionimicrobium sp. PCR01-08-3]